MKKLKPLWLLLRARRLQIADRKTKEGIERWMERRGHALPYSRLEDVADEVGVSALQLSYFFRFIIGKPFPTWRKEIRILDAQALLIKYPEKSIASIGEAVGILDKSNFRKQFKEVSKLSPTEFREQYSSTCSKNSNDR